MSASSPMPLALLQIPVGNVNCYSPGFRNLIENHLIFLRNRTSTINTPIEAIVENKYKGDFYQLLLYLGIDQDLFWITLRLNNLHNPLDYSGNLGTILIPADSTIKDLLAIFINNIGIS